MILKLEKKTGVTGLLFFLYSFTLGKQATFHAIQVWWILPPDSTAPHLALNHPMISIVAAGCSHDMLSRFLSTP